MCHRTYLNKYSPGRGHHRAAQHRQHRVLTLLLAGDEEKPQLSFSIDMEKALVNALSVRRVMVDGRDHVDTGRHEAVADAAHEWLVSLG